MFDGLLENHRSRVGAAARSILNGHLLTAAGAQTGVRWRPGERLHDLFERRCDELVRSGDGAVLAVDGPTARLSYAELDARANQLARWLRRSAGVVRGERVALLLPDPVEGYVAMLAVLKAGAAFVPLDPELPPARLAFMLEDAGARFALCTSQSAGALADGGAVLEALALDALTDEIIRESTARPQRDGPPARGDELCYVIYTSGSSGRPKGVAVSHRSICNFLRVADEVYGVRGEDRMYQGLTLAFDFSFEEIWVTWMAGATLVPRPSGARLLGEELHSYLTEHGVTALCSVPTVLATLPGDLPQVRFLLVSGETCPPDLAARWQRPGRRFLNVYGPTEATVSATWAVLEPGRPLTIGVPLPSYTVMILDPDAARTLAPGELGELAIAGVGVAGGYLNREAETRRAFIEDFLALPGNPSGRIYRTGDLARINADGELEHHGRIDAQVKIRGYRIETGEIEAALRRAPGIRDAVVWTYETEPGLTELVGYYIADHAADLTAVHRHLRTTLPRYMVPAYLERVDGFPIGVTGKLDRRHLPPPSGPRHGAVHGEDAAPESELEARLASELAAALGAERVSVQADFFDELGANSLVMARFNAAVRDSRPDAPCISMREVYSHRTIRALAAAIAPPEAVPDAAGQRLTDRVAPPAAPVAVGVPRLAVCGALQALAFIAYVTVAAVGLDAAVTWVLAASGAVQIYVRAVLAGYALLLATGVAPIAAKWLLIGRFTPRRIRVWSLAYVRFWIAKTLIVSNPVARLVIGTPLYGLYLRALGAKVGRRALILSHHIPVCADLLRIGDDAVINKDVFFNGYRARAGVIETGPVRIGAGAYVGERSLLEIDTGIGDRGELGHGSSLQSGQFVPAGACWHGTPAEPSDREQGYRTVAPARVGPWRALGSAAGRWFVLVAIAGPLELGIAAVGLTHRTPISQLGAGAIPSLAGLMLTCVILGSILFATLVPRALTRFLRVGRTYPLYGRHHWIQRTIARASNNPLLLELFGDTSAIVHYLRALGYRLGVVEQTGSNFGITLRHDVPGLCSVGSGTLVSDGLSMINAEFSSTSFRVREARVGAHNFLGNGISYPPGSRAGDDCLLATRVMVPTTGPLRTGVGLLGSPCFEIPRSVQRDRHMSQLGTGTERRRRLRAKARHNAITVALALAVLYVLLVGELAIAAVPLRGAGAGELGITVGSVLLELGFAIALLVLAERASLGWRALEPRACSMYVRDFWRHERYWKLSSVPYLRLFDGTPFKPLLWRALGVTIGRGVFDDGLTIVERSLTRIGDGCTFSMGAVLQGHSLEDGAFKTDRIELGRDCTIGTNAFVHYGVRIGDAAELTADAFLMKGSIVRAGESWAGNPASADRGAGAATDRLRAATDRLRSTSRPSARR